MNSIVVFQNGKMKTVSLAHYPREGRSPRELPIDRSLIWQSCSHQRVMFWKVKFILSGKNFLIHFFPPPAPHGRKRPIARSDRPWKETLVRINGPPPRCSPCLTFQSSVPGKGFSERLFRHTFAKNVDKSSYLPNRTSKNNHSEAIFLITYWYYNVFWLPWN